MQRMPTRVLESWRLLEDALSGRLLLIAVLNGTEHQRLATFIHGWDSGSHVVVSATGARYRLLSPAKRSQELDLLEDEARVKTSIFVAIDVSQKLWAQDETL